MDVRAYNREAWNREVDRGENPWTRPVGPEVIARARQGDWSVLLTENVPVPREWFPPMPGLRLLALASGGGQQGPIFAAAGADVTVFDNSPRQLDRDREVAQREGLTRLRTVEGDARDLSQVLTVAPLPMRAARPILACKLLVTPMPTRAAAPMVTWPARMAPGEIFA